MKLFIKDLLEGRERNPNMLSWHTELTQFKTIELSLPRQVGKTTFLTEYFNEHSSMLFVPTQCLAEQIEGSVNGNSDFLSQFRGFPRTHKGLKIQAILVDEYYRMNDNFDFKLSELTRILHDSKGLTYDFHIIKLGTK